MRKSILISGRDPEEFAEAYSKTYASLSHCEHFDEKFLTNTSMYLFYDDPRPEVTDELIEKIRVEAEEAFAADYDIETVDPKKSRTKTIRIQLTVDVPERAHCCDCENYIWEIGCPFHDKVKKLSPACPLFNMYFGRGDRR